MSSPVAAARSVASSLIGGKPEREFDIILFGATGYTGEHTARAIAKMAAPGGAWPTVKWAIAGRSESKLQAISAKWNLKPTGIVVADTTDKAALEAMAARGSVVMNATGPYRFYGEAVVSACINSKANYCDLCGEPEFIDRCMLHYADAAKAAGVLIVHSCAFDSVPADIGTLFTALQFPPPALCAHADMYHTFSVEGETTGANGHATTFYAAVHGFGSVSATRKQRKQLVEKLEAEAAGSSKGPPPLGSKLRVAPGPTFKKELGKYAFLFPGADVAVVRSSQRVLARYPRTPSEPYLTPQFGASFCVTSPLWAFMTALVGGAFNLLARYSFGRKLLLKHPEAFTLGAFSDAGPTEETLAASSFKSVFLAKGWSSADVADPPTSGFDRACTVSVSGPEPGYIATALMYATMARVLVDERSSFPVQGGVFTPGGLIGSGGVPAVTKLVEALRAVGVRFDVEKPLREIAPKPFKPANAKRPAWQSALNAAALVGWSGVLGVLLSTWQTVAWPSALHSCVLALEGVCIFEVLQIVLGLARGNLLVGVLLHTIRMLIFTVVLPQVPTLLATKLFILSWAATEVCRYPMFLFDKSQAARVARYVAPAFTFPLGALSEAYCAYRALAPLAAVGGWRYVAACGLVVSNLTLGPYQYPDVLKKARNALKPPKKD